MVLYPSSLLPLHFSPWCLWCTSSLSLTHFQEENGAAWISWLLDAIHKIKYQKQRPNVERVAACIRQHHPQYSNETVFQVRKCYQCNVTALLFLDPWKRKALDGWWCLFILATWRVRQKRFDTPLWKQGENYLQGPGDDPARKIQEWIKTRTRLWSHQDIRQGCNL